MSVLCSTSFTITNLLEVNNSFMGKGALGSVIAYQPSSQGTVTAATIIVNINDTKKTALKLNSDFQLIIR